MSARTQSDDVLRQMEAYDFKGQITATVIFNDSDEDNGSPVGCESTENNNCYSKKKLDSIVAEIIGEIGKISEGTKKRCSGDLEHQKEKKKKQDDCVAKSAAGMLNSSTDHLTNSCNTPISRTDQCSMNTRMSTCPLPSNDGIGHTSLFQNQDDITMKANECMQNLLNTVSTHMVLIMKSFVDYNTFCINSLSDITIVERARKRFLDTKKHFFYLSYSTVVNIMIPKETDGAFVKYFINNTIKMAQYRHLYPTYAEMYSLYSEMICWVKSNSQPLKAVNSCNPYVQNSLSIGLLNKDVPSADRLTINNTSNTNHTNRQHQCSEKTSNCSDSTCIKCGTLGRDISINPTSTVLNIQSASQQIQNQNLNIYQPQRENMSRIENFIRISEQETGKNLNSLTFNTGKQTQKANQILQMSDKTDNLGNSRNFEQAFEVFRSSYYNEQLQTSNQQGSKNKPKKSNQRKAQRSTKQPPAQPNPISPPDIIFSRPPPSYPSTQLQQQNIMTPQFYASQNTTSAHYNPDFQQDIHGQVDVNRSSSRDSGFMSPLSSVDEMCHSPMQDQANQAPSLTPMITHVTSLNPSVAFIKDGRCHVCGNHTKQKCLGCYKTYYCSNQCQMADWKFHVAICKV